MAKKSNTKREFDWRSYTKPARLLSPEQEVAFAEGVLAPLLRLALDRPDVRPEIRARQMAFYCLGTMLLRVRSGENGFIGEIDANVRLPRSERTGNEQLETWPLDTAEGVASAVAELDALCGLTVSFAHFDETTERGVLHAFADANASADGDLVVIDTEYQYGKRRFDFVAMKRAEGVAGPGGFTTPRLVVGQLKSAPRPLAGSSGLSPYVADFADFARALGGSHLALAKTELADLFAQRQRLGLAQADIPLRHLTEDDPLYLVTLAGFPAADEMLDAPLVEMHEKLVAKHYSPDLLRLTAIEDIADLSQLRLNADALMTYREFKGYRKRLRG